MYKEETFKNLVIFFWICTRKEIYIKSSRQMLSIIIIAGMRGYRRSLWPKNIGKCITNGIKIFHQKMEVYLEILQILHLGRERYSYNSLKNAYRVLQGIR